MAGKKRIIKVTYTKLGRAKVWGWSHGSYEIELESSLKGKKLLEILNHEILHELFPQAQEEEIEYKAGVLTRTLWEQGFRRVDNEDKQKLQDDK